MTEPTDEELLDCARGKSGHVDFARAVLTRWGQPAHSGEPGYLDRLIDRLSMPPQSMMPRDLRALHAEAALMLRSAQGAAPQPVERDPLPSVEIMRIVMGVEQQHNFLRGTTNWATAVGRAVERAHGIGDQHG